MIEPPADVGRRMRARARQYRLAERYWAGWKLTLTFGPYTEALPAANVTHAQALASELLSGYKPADPAALAALERDLWHLSASWRGGTPAEEGRTALAALLVALEVPEQERAGHQPIRGPWAQVTHWIWRDALKTGANPAVSK